jgi:ATP-binding cassette subfamily B protein
MNLKISLPNGVPEDGITFSLPFDISRLTGGKRGPTHGHVTANRENISVYVRDKQIISRPVTDFSSYEVVQMVGCSMLRAREKEEKDAKNGKWLCLAAFSQSQFLRFAELAKILDFYVETGTFIDESDADEPNCPKCGRSLGGTKECVYCVDKLGVISQMLGRMLPYRKFFLLTLIADVFLYAEQMLFPLLQRILIDNVVTPMLPDWSLIAAIGSIMVGLGVTDIAAFYVIYIAFAKFSAGYSRDLRRDVFAKTQELSMSSVHRRTAGELINRVSGDVDMVQGFVSDFGRDMAMQTLALITVSIIMFVLNWKLALLVVLPYPLVFWLSVKARRLIGMMFDRTWRRHTTAQEVLHDAIHGIRVVKNYGSEKREYKKYVKASEEWSDAISAAERRWQAIMPPLRLLLAFGEFAVIYVGGTMVLGMDLSLGEMVQFTAYVWALYGPIEWLMRMPRLLAQAMVSAGKVFELLNEKVDLIDSRKSRIIDIEGKVTFNDVYFGYKAYNPVLKNISCVINPGEMVGLVGHSGAGKSTFINLIMRLYDVTSGEVKIDGVDVRDIAQTCLRSQVGVVLQENFLFNGSVLDNIRYAKPESSFEEIVKSAKVANCHDFIAQLPDGYNTIVGERGYNLSGGERQRIAIARAILHNPKIIILDEATASLDTQTEKQIQEALGRLTQGRTTIAIAHRLSTLSRADRLIVFDKGRVAEIGTHNELMSQGGVYYSLVMAQRQTARIRKAEQETARSR